MIISDKNNSVIRLILLRICQYPNCHQSAVSQSPNYPSINQHPQKTKHLLGKFSFIGNSFFKIISNYDEIQKIIYHGFANGKLISE